MKLSATEKGLLSPKEMLGDHQYFEIIQEAEKIIITGINKASYIWDLGSNPVECDVKDGAINHDRYLYHK